MRPPSLPPARWLCVLAGALACALGPAVSVCPSTQIPGMGELRGQRIRDHLAIGGAAGARFSSSLFCSPEAWELGSGGSLLAHLRALTAK